MEEVYRSIALAKMVRVQNGCGRMRACGMHAPGPGAVSGWLLLLLPSWRGSVGSKGSYSLRIKKKSLRFAGNIGKAAGMFPRRKYSHHA